jgi:hypothetical protein
MTLAKVRGAWFDRLPQIIEPLFCGIMVSRPVVEGMNAAMRNNAEGKRRQLFPRS